VIAGFVGLLYRFPALADRILGYYLFLPTASQLSTFRTIQTTGARGLLAFFSRGLLESFWGRFGWLNVRLAAQWYLLMGVLSVVAFLGVGEWLTRTKAHTSDRPAWAKRTVLTFAGSVALANVLVIAREYRTWAHFAVTRPDMHMISTPQGRYLFPVIVPIATLFVLGIREAFPRRWRPVGWATSLLSVFVLDVVSILGYILPFYLGR